MSKSTRLLVYSLPLLFAALAGFFFGRITSPGWQIVADGGGATKSSIVQASAVPVPQVFGPPHSNRTDGQPLESAIRHMADKLASEAQFDDMVQKLVEWAKTDPDAALNFAHGHFAGQQQIDGAYPDVIGTGQNQSTGGLELDLPEGTAKLSTSGYCT
jgi:hypothetical protein